MHHEERRMEIGLKFGDRATAHIWQIYIYHPKNKIMSP